MGSPIVSFFRYIFFDKRYITSITIRFAINVPCILQQLKVPIVYLIFTYSNKTNINYQILNFFLYIYYSLCFHVINVSNNYIYHQSSYTESLY